MAPRGRKRAGARQGVEGEGCLQNSRGYLIVSDGQKKGERGKFQSRVDDMVGEGEGGSAICTKLLWRKCW